MQKCGFGSFGTRSYGYPPEIRGQLCVRGGQSFAVVQGTPGQRAARRPDFQQHTGRPGSLTVQVWAVEQMLDTTGGMVAGLPRRILN